MTVFSVFRRAARLLSLRKTSPLLPDPPSLTAGFNGTKVCLSIFSQLDRRGDQSGNQDKGQDAADSAAPQLSASAIVGIAIIGAMFFCIAAAAMLRFFTRSPDNINPSSLYRPEDVSQLEHMKQVREFNHAAALERAEEARYADEQESERKRRERVMMNRILATGGGRFVRQSNGDSPRKSIADRREEWRRKMSLSAMEARGGYEVDSGERWPMAGFPVERRPRETLMGGARDYSEGVYADVSDSSGSARGGSSRGSSGRKGKQPERGLFVVGGDPNETKRFTSPAALGSGPQSGQERQLEEGTQWHAAPIKSPDYYD